MHSVLFHLGPFTVYGYGLMIALGVIVGFAVSCRLASKAGLNSDMMFNLGIIGVIGGIAGAKLLFYVTELPNIIQDPSMLLNAGEGFVVYGGLIAGILCPVIYARKKKVSFFDYLDRAVIGVALGQAFGRIGCFLAGCCYGAPTDSWFGVVFPEGGLAPAGIKLIPVQLISSAGDFASAAILYAFLRRKPGAGVTAGLYLVLYSVGRFLIEFLRNDERGAVGVLSTSQFIAIFTLLAGISVIFIKRKKSPKA